MDPLTELEAGSLEHEHGHGSGSLDLDPSIAAHLGLIDLLQTLVNVHAEKPDPAIARIRLSASAVDDFRGNPVDVRGFKARSVALWNPNAFTVFLGIGAQRGTADGRTFIVPASKLVVLPVDDEVFSVGTAAANIAGAEAEVVVIRFAEVLPPAAYAL